MNSFPDMKTIMLAYCVILFSLAIAMVYVATTRPRYPGFLAWTYSTAWSALGLTLVVMRGVLPDSISIVAANMMIWLGIAFVCRGMNQFAGKPNNPWLDFGPLALALPIYLHYTLADNSMKMRLFFGALFLCYYFMRGAYISWRKLPEVMGDHNFLLTGSFVALGIINLVRALVTYIVGHPAGSYLGTDVFQAPFLLLILFFNTLFTVNFIIINSQRLEKDLADSEKRTYAAKIEAEAANEAKSRFLAAMSHEIRTPLNAVIGMAHLAMDTAEDFRRREFLSNISSSGKSLLSVVNNILDYSKLDAGRVSLEKNRFEIDDVLTQVESIVRLGASEKNLDLIFSVSPATPFALTGDFMHLKQVLVNLLGNAIKFTHEGEVGVRVEVIDQDAMSIELHFLVWDTGIGISPDQAQSLFNPFVQADSSVSRQYGGTGLGLSISKRLVDLMGGHIWVEERPGGGSNFFFTVRLGKAEGGERSSLIDAAWEAMPVLVVDSAAASGKAVCDALAGLSFAPALALTPAQAQKAWADAKNKGAAYKIILVAQELFQAEDFAWAKDAPLILLASFRSRQQRSSPFGENGFKVLAGRPITRLSLAHSMRRLFNPDYQEGSVEQTLTQQGEKFRRKIEGASILLAEDNEVNRILALEFLSRVGIVADTAKNGLEALKAVRKKRYDLVLMDIQMPVMDGLSAARAIRQDPCCKDLPIIAMTAHTMSSDIEKSLAAGMNEHLSKPVDPEALYLVLSRWIKGPKDKEPLSALDVDGGLQKLGNDLEIYFKLLKIFRQEHKPDVENIPKLIKQGDMEGLKTLAHSVKGAAVIIASPLLANAAWELEQVIINNMDAVNKAGAFRDALEQTLQAIDLEDIE